MTQMSRHEERQAAMQILFAATKEVPDDNQMDLNYDLVLGKRSYQAFLPQLVNGVLATSKELDEELAKHLVTGWKLDRIARLNLVILRMASYELTLPEPTPYKVVVDEAVELAKEYATVEDAQFINGVLKNFAPANVE
ncbi:transcription antitermination factor NusB [Fructobacillus fructosus]|uniref:Transcription antitermination protein NusB n=1 Tax=Fructobacillus fructosus TaxID=1631 RepID=A0ABM9MUR7_9LACO|nr:transcription antitermination factor NusB [Fructobacillus fructosus]MBD9364992.1 transcription antitermination factor NusB [Leuconostoc mesenteroides]KRN52574.1 NusB antitermination factor [Fructobacillus fructosus KCTC 3544]MBC9118515.1 transcription antitermination factor NusB [Fructobacillus fructosus]MCK8638453.1 transcription antitermination factor NusB [Fructobacillus fructosus]CAK1230840.1 Transcription antitermination protein NusB (NusB) [Fructobacillus fructosus]